MIARRCLTIGSEFEKGSSIMALIAIRFGLLI